MHDIENVPLKIVHVIHNLSPKFGGPTTVLKALAKEQANVGHNVTILTTNLDYPKGILTLQRNGTVNGSLVKIEYHPSEISTGFFSTGIAKRLNDSVHKADILHIWCLYRFPQAYACFIARKNRCPYIVRPCGALEPFLYRQSAISMPLKRIYEKLIEWPNIRKAAAINCVTKQEAINLPDFISRENVFVIGNGLGWGEDFILPEYGRFRKRFGVNNDPMVLFLGRINFKKGLDLLIPAFSNVAKKHPTAKLAIVGPDNDGYGRKVRNWCREAGILGKVIFVEYLSPEEVRQAYVDADVFVLPSYTENFGMTVVEAMACGCPVIVSNQVNICREVQEGGAGLVVDLNHIKIEEAICLVLSNKDLAKQMGRDGKQNVKKHYSWPSIVEQMTKVYKDSINEYRKNV